MADPTLSDRLALAACPLTVAGGMACPAPCVGCLAIAKAVAHEIADTLYAVACHQPDAEPSIQDGWKALERTQDLRMWPPIDPEKEAAAIAIARELRGPDA
jgi:hypothetical protein